MKLPAMRFMALPPALCAVVGFALTMVCIFAGSQPGYIEDVNLITLNTSMIGIHALAPSSSNSPPSSSSGVLGGLTSDISSLGHGLGDDVQNEINDGISDLAHHLNVSDFYSWHLLTACKGYYEPGPVINATNLSPWKNVTSCSNRTGFYTFNATALLQNSFHGSINLTDLDWPTGMETAIDTVVGATRAIFVLYCMAAATAGLAMFTGFAAVVRGGMHGAMFNAGLQMFAFLVLGLASAIATTVIGRVQDAVAEVGSEIGIEAIKGYKFITLTWVAVLMMALGSIGWTVDFHLAKRQMAKAVSAEALREKEAAASDPEA